MRQAHFRLEPQIMSEPFMSLIRTEHQMETQSERMNRRKKRVWGDRE